MCELIEKKRVYVSTCEVKIGMIEELKKTVESVPLKKLRKSEQYKKVDHSITIWVTNEKILQLTEIIHACNYTC